MPRFFELFAGAGGMTMGFEAAGWECVGHAEIEPHARAVLRHRWPDVPLHGDVAQLDGTTLPPFDLLTFGAPCFTAGHTVLTRRGLVAIESVVVGDEVWTHQSRWRKVTHTMTRTAPVLRMHGQGHNAMMATADHPFWATDTTRTWNGNGVTRGVSAPDWVAASEMAGKRWATPLSVDGGEVPSLLSSVDAAYLCGLYLGDGHIRTEGNKKCVVLSVHREKDAHIHATLQAAWGAVTRMKHGPSVDRIQLSRTLLATTIADEFGMYSHGKTLPVWALSAAVEWRTALLQGVLHTDGSAIRNGFRVTTVSRSLAIGIRLLAASLGYSTALHWSPRPKTTVIEGRTVNQRDTYTVMLRNGNRSSEVISDGFAWGLVRKVVPQGEAQVFDITVDEDHSFVCDGLVVHNCQDLSIAGKRAGMAEGSGTRSSLFFEAIRIWKESTAPLALYENVLGAYSSNNGNDFAAVLSAFVGAPVPVPADGWRGAGVASGPAGIAAWRTLDLQHFGWNGDTTPQRRRRVFVLGTRTGDVDPAEVLLVADGLLGHLATGGEAREGTAEDVGASVDGKGAYPIDVRNATRTTDKDEQNRQGSGIGEDGDPSPTLTGLFTPAVVAYDDRNQAASTSTHHTLRADGIGSRVSDAVLQSEATAFNWQSGGDVRLEPRTEQANTLQANQTQAVILRNREGKPGGGKGPLVSAERETTLGTSNDQVVFPIISMGAHTAAPGSNGQDAIPIHDAMLRAGVGVPRRLMPVETERLMGWPSGWTEYGTDENGKVYALSDTARYKLCGNGCGSPVLAWIGMRLKAGLDNQ